MFWIHKKVHNLFCIETAFFFQQFINDGMRKSVWQIFTEMFSHISSEEHWNTIMYHLTSTFTILLYRKDKANYEVHTVFWCRTFGGYKHLTSLRRHDENMQECHILYLYIILMKSNR